MEEKHVPTQTDSESQSNDENTGNVAQGTAKPDFRCKEQEMTSPQRNESYEVESMALSGAGDSERSVADAVTRPMSEAIQVAFLETLSRLGIGQGNEKLASNMHISPWSFAESERLGTMTLKETVERGFQMAMTTLTGMNLSEESINEVEEEKYRLERALFEEESGENCALQLGADVNRACNSASTAADQLHNFLDDILKEKKVTVMKMFRKLRPQEIKDVKRLCETIKATVELVHQEVRPLLELSSDPSRCIGRGTADGTGRVYNGYDSVLTILLQLMNGIAQTIRIIIGLHHKFINLIWWKNYNNQLRRVYGIIFTCNKISSMGDPSQTLFVQDSGDDLDPDILKSIIKTDELFGRFFGFHYPLELRNLLQVVNIARESTTSAANAAPGARNVAQGCGALNNESFFQFLGYFILYGNLLALNHMGLDIKQASSIGSDKDHVTTVEGARLYLNLIDDPFLVAGSKFASAEPHAQKNFVVEVPGLQPIEMTLITFMNRPLHLPTHLPAENWMERKVSSFLTDDVRVNVQKDINFFSEKIGVFMNPGAHTLAKALIIHFHGGGFIGQSSKSHASYTRLWASQLPDAVIVSIDYKLAPEEKYPYAVEEGVAAYEWVLENSSDMGTLGEKVVFCGDSAGGNIALAVAMRCIQKGMRKPDGVVLAYPALNLTVQWSPARLMALFDPMLPYTLLRLCLEAYIPEGAKPEEDFILSPVCVPRDFAAQLPPVSIFVGAFDPLLDDSVQFVHRMKSSGRNDAQLRIYENLPHGFLGMAPVLDKAMNAAHDISRRIAEYLDVEFHDSTSRRTKSRI